MLLLAYSKTAQQSIHEILGSVSSCEGFEFCDWQEYRPTVKPSLPVYINTKISNHFVQRKPSGW